MKSPAISSPAGHLMHLEATDDTHRELLACLEDIAAHVPG